MFCLRLIKGTKFEKEILSPGQGQVVMLDKPLIQHTFNMDVPMYEHLTCETFAWEVHGIGGSSIPFQLLPPFMVWSII